MLGWRILLLGVFLTPATRLLVVQGVGVSWGDVLLILGGLAMLATRPTTRLFNPAPFLLCGALVMVAVLTSALAHQSSPWPIALSLAAQYGVVFVLLPFALSRCTPEQAMTLAKAFVFGLGASIVLGLVIVTYLPGVELELLLRGWLYEQGDGRQGLFAGVGELPKMSGMCIPLVYYLTLRRRIRATTAAGLLMTFTVGLVVARSGAGVLVAAVAVAVLAVAHLALRPRGLVVGGTTRKAVLALGLGALGAWYLVTRLDEAGAGYGAGFSARILSPATTRGFESVGSGRLRFTLAEEGWAAIGEHPIAGVGPGLYESSYSVYGQGVHMVPLMMWAETGLLALVAWILLVLSLAAAVIRSARTAPTAAVTAASLFAAFVTMNMTLPYLYPRGLFLPVLLAYCLLGISERAGSADLGHNEDRARGKDRGRHVVRRSVSARGSTP